MISLRIVYFANILVTAWISYHCIFNTSQASKIVFDSAFAQSNAIKLVGVLWFAIMVLSILGLFYPLKMSPILLFQLIYKSSWLFLAALPAILGGSPYPKSMASFFVAWVLILPWVIPWKNLFT